jgi:hypothetical protein
MIETGRPLLIFSCRDEPKEAVYVDPQRRKGDSQPIVEPRV